MLHAGACGPVQNLAFFIGMEGLWDDELAKSVEYAGRIGMRTKRDGCVTSGTFEKVEVICRVRKMRP
jgi:hypothetical protein